MVSPSLGLRSLKASVLERSFQTSSDCGMIASKRRLVERLWVARKRMVNLALASQVKRGKGKAMVNTRGDSSSQVGTGKDLSKVKCFHSHKKGHCASQCLERNKGGNKTQPKVVASAKAQVDDFTEKFEQT
jgi:hypothetical protein